LRPALALAVTIASLLLLGLSEFRIRDQPGSDLWVAMWLFWYAATVAVAVGWVIAAVQMSRRHRGLNWGPAFAMSRLEEARVSPQPGSGRPGASLAANGD
jgi:hypothetical protein